MYTRGCLIKVLDMDKLQQKSLGVRQWLRLCPAVISSFECFSSGPLGAQKSMGLHLQRAESPCEKTRPLLLFTTQVRSPRNLANQDQCTRQRLFCSREIDGLFEIHWVWVQRFSSEGNVRLAVLNMMKSLLLKVKYRHYTKWKSLCWGITSKENPQASQDLISSWLGGNATPGADGNIPSNRMSSVLWGRRVTGRTETEGGCCVYDVNRCWLHVTIQRSQFAIKF